MIILILNHTCIYIYSIYTNKYIHHYTSTIMLHLYTIMYIYIYIYNSSVYREKNDINSVPQPIPKPSVKALMSQTHGVGVVLPPSSGLLTHHLQRRSAGKSMGKQTIKPCFIKQLGSENQPKWWYDGLLWDTMGYDWYLIFGWTSGWYMVYIYTLWICMFFFQVIPVRPRVGMEQLR